MPARRVIDRLPPAPRHPALERRELRAQPGMLQELHLPGIHHRPEVGVGMGAGRLRVRRRGGEMIVGHDERAQVRELTLVTL